MFTLLLSSIGVLRETTLKKDHQSIKYVWFFKNLDNVLSWVELRVVRVVNGELEALAADHELPVAQVHRGKTSNGIWKLQVHLDLPVFFLAFFMDH